VTRSSEVEDAAESAHRFFDAIARSYDRTFAPSARDTAEDLDALLRDVASGSTALDLGCGTGRAWPHLVARGLKTIAIDASMPMLAESSRRASSSSVVRLRADVYLPWPIADRSIDVVLALHAVLAHPPGDARRAWQHVGREIRRVTRPGALVAIDLPTPGWARTNLHALDGDRYRSPEGPIAVVAEPADVVSALDLPLEIVASPLGVRALTRRS
jgi:SAM-dependent methyltransferase